MMGTSTAEAMPITPTPTERDRRAELTWYLRATISPAEAEAMASPGYRSVPCGGCARRGCRWCEEEPAEQVHTGGRRSSADPRFVRVVIARLGQFDASLVRRVPRAVADLPPDERLVVLLDFGLGLPHQQIADQLKVSRSTVLRLRERALDRLVAAVWG